MSSLFKIQHITASHFVTREIPSSLKPVAKEIECLVKRKVEKNVRVDPFNHVTLLFYYPKTADLNDSMKQMLGFHTDNVYSHWGVFEHAKNSQVENTVTAVLTLGDDHKLLFREQKLVRDKDTEKIVWKTRKDRLQLPFNMKNNSVFILNPNDEITRQRGTHDRTLSRFQHGGVKCPGPNCLSVALVFRTVCCARRVYGKTGKLLTAKPSPEKDDLLKAFCEGGRLQEADENLKHLWSTVCERHFANLKTA